MIPTNIISLADASYNYLFSTNAQTGIYGINCCRALSKCSKKRNFCVVRFLVEHLRLTAETNLFEKSDNGAIKMDNVQEKCF